MDGSASVAVFTGFLYQIESARVNVYVILGIAYNVGNHVKRIERFTAHSLRACLPAQRDEFSPPFVRLFVYFHRGRIDVKVTKFSFVRPWSSPLAEPSETSECSVFFQNFQIVKNCILRIIVPQNDPEDLQRH